MALIAAVPPTDEPRLAADYADPVIKWAGGKRGLRRELLALIPSDINTYFEPFLGGASLFLALAPQGAVLNDANRELIDLYRLVGQDPSSVMAELDELQPHVLDRDFYYAMRSESPATLPPARRAARFIFLNKTCYNGLYRVNAAGQFNVPFGRYAKSPALYNRENFIRVAALLRAAKLSDGDFVSALKSAGEGDFVYFDPPYVPLTPTASFTRYTADSFGEKDQRRLAESIHNLAERGCRFLLSNSDTPLVRQLYPPPYRISEVHAPRNINSNAARRQKISELAIRNYAKA